MKKAVLSRKIARISHVPPAAAADHVDSIVSGLVRKLRQGEPARIPGLGLLRPEPGGVIQVVQERKEKK